MRKKIITIIILLFTMFQMKGQSQTDTVLNNVSFKAIMHSKMVFQTFVTSLSSRIQISLLN